MSGAVDPGAVECSTVRFKDKKCLKKQKFKNFICCGLHDFMSVVYRHQAAIVSISCSVKPPEVIRPPVSASLVPGDAGIAT